MVDFNRRWPISCGINKGGRKKREKKRRTWRFFRPIRCLRAISSSRAGRRNVSPHGVKERGDDQAIAIVTELCKSSKPNSIEPETQSVCCLLLQMLERSLYLELCVSQTCGIRPVLGRIEDFTKDIKGLIHGMTSSAFDAKKLTF
ncbi:hypothetical protein GW17_00002310 [Ensete ventricosum]|nr:hypothetical protein GW17_00002310 [Ensete ventricosum]